MQARTDNRAKHRGARESAGPRGGRFAAGPGATFLIFICLPWLIGSRAFAEEAHVLVLPEIVIGGDKDKPAGPQHCADNDPAAAKGIDCLNQKLKREVDRVNPPTFNVPPLDARSPDPKVGVINIPGVQQQYGKNFGVSAVPFRPPAAVFGRP
jgi:hypothetical protein